MSIERNLIVPQPLRARARAATGAPGAILFALFLAAHVVLVIAMRFAPAFATMHAGVTILLAIAVAATRPMHDVSCALAYITGAEVLWRMTRAGLPHEIGKYAVALVALIALARLRTRRDVTLAAGYFLLLVPSAALTVIALDVESARQQLSFNLSGPLSLALCVTFFSSVRLTPQDIRRTFCTLMGPVFAMAVLMYFSTASMREIEFTTTSNVATSGGFGPNQVSATLGLALLFVVLLLFEGQMSWRSRVPLIGLAAVFAVQAALTFSRGGLFIALASAVAAMLYLVRDPRSRLTLLVLAAVFFVAADVFVVPELEEFTRGKLGERYSSVDPSGRGKLASFDLQIFLDAPLIGVGPGMGLEIRKELGHYGVAHTEFTRMLAEHGLLGIGALILLMAMAVRAIRRARGLRARAFGVAMIVWFALYLSINAMRTVAPSFAFGLAFAMAFRPRGAQQRTGVSA